jgi:hypothetical protein
MGWRQIVEHKHRTANLSEWHRQKGRHAIYANGATVPLQSLTVPCQTGPAPQSAGAPAAKSEVQ